MAASVTTLRSGRANPPRSAGDGPLACDGRAMSPIAEPPPAIWNAPVTPLRVVRAFRPGTPYAAGGHRGIDLRARPGAPVRAPCGGVVTFRGAVGGGPPTVTIRCGALRATLQRVRPTVVRGEAVVAGATVGVAADAAVDLSARQADDTYLDPAALLTPASPRVPPALGPRRPSMPTPRAQHPARVADRALVTPEGAPSASAARPTVAAAVDRPLGLVGAALAASSIIALTLTAVRHGRRGPGRAARALRPRAQR